MYEVKYLRLWKHNILKSIWFYIRSTIWKTALYMFLPSRWVLIYWTGSLENQTFSCFGIFRYWLTQCQGGKTPVILKKLLWRVVKTKYSKSLAKLLTIGKLCREAPLSKSLLSKYEQFGIVKFHLNSKLRHLVSLWDKFVIFDLNWTE